MLEKPDLTNLPGRTENGTLAVSLKPTLAAAFYRSASGSEPVLDWLRSLQPQDKRAIGEELRTVQIGWPLGMPLVRKMEPGLWEARVSLENRIARILFTVAGREMILLHGFVKKSRQTPKEELELARKRMRAILST
jgi:phage-related protein